MLLRLVLLSLSGVSARGLLDWTGATPVATAVLNVLVSTRVADRGRRSAAQTLVDGVEAEGHAVSWRCAPYFPDTARRCCSGRVSQRYSARACIAPERRDALRMTDGAVISRARRAGFVIMQRELPNGALVWTWRGGNDSAGPGFTTRREAFAWMSD